MGFVRLNFLFLALSIFSAALVAAYEDYDIVPEEIGPLCKMVKEFVDTKQPPKPQPLDPPVTGANCHYFKWVSCEKASPDPNRPCGWYEMKKCEGSKKKRDAIVHHGTHHEKLEAGENQPRGKRHHNPAEQPRPGPILLGFPNELPPKGFDSFFK